MAGYNHYTPLSDGSYRRSTVQEHPRRPQPKPVPPPPPKPPEPPCPDLEPKPPCPPPQSNCPPQQGAESILSFLRNLLPRQIDAADLLVISLLLLMNREESCEGMSPLLTIALYFLL